MNKIVSELKQNRWIKPGTSIVVGFSGGPDSLTLLHALAELRVEYNLKIIPVHINHELRENANREKEHAIELAKELGLKCITYDVDCKKYAKENKLSLEEAGREIRYTAFDEVAKDVDSSKEKADVVIAVAQNKDDQGETVLFRAIRGTGIKGICGIRPKRTDELGFTVIHPLLDISRDEIEAYIDQNNLVPNIDETNSSRLYARNKLRIDVLPYIKENINSNAIESLTRLGEIARAEDDYMYEAAERAYEEDVKESFGKGERNLTVSITFLNELHLAIKRRVISMMLSSFDEDIASFEVVKGICSLVESDNPSGMMNLSKGYVVKRDYEELSVSQSTEESSMREETKNDSSQGDLSNVIIAKVSKDAFDKEKQSDAERGDSIIGVFDYEKFVEKHPAGTDSLTIRARQKGDFISIGNGKHKKIQDLLVDEKVSKDRRNLIKMLASGSEVLWVLPSDSFKDKSKAEKGRLSGDYKVDDETINILQIKIYRD